MGGSKWSVKGRGGELSIGSSKSMLGCVSSGSNSLSEDAVL